MTSEKQDAQALTDLLGHLAGLRRYLRIPQEEVARRMGISRKSVSVLECGGGPLRFSTLQAYARALGARLSAEVQHPAPAGSPDAPPESP